MRQMKLRSIAEADRHEVADLIHGSINTWYQTHGLPKIFTCESRLTDVFYSVYNALTPGYSVVAEHPETGRLMGSCFYHPRKHHVSLGIMNVHPNYFGLGVGRALLQHIIDFTDRSGKKALRLTSSALNLDSFSLYNRAGFVPRAVYQDLTIAVPAGGLQQTTTGLERVRPAILGDIPAMAALEMHVSGISREEDYAYCIANHAGFWHAAVYENARGGIDGFMISSAHPALNMLGPCVALSEQETAALILAELRQHAGRSPVFLVPAERHSLVRTLYDWGARNCELHLCQVRGEFQPFQGINMPTFLPETG